MVHEIQYNVTRERCLRGWEEDEGWDEEIVIGETEHHLLIRGDVYTEGNEYRVRDFECFEGDKTFKLDASELDYAEDMLVDEQRQIDMARRETVTKLLQELEGQRLVLGDELCDEIRAGITDRIYRHGWWMRVAA